MEFRDLKKQYEVLKPAIDAAVLDVFQSAEFISGKPVQILEQKLAQYVGVKHCITCANGTDALSLALMAWGIGPGDAVFVPDFTFFASAEVVSFAGATPVFVDVHADTFNIDAGDLERAIHRAEEQGLKPAVVMPVDLFGLCADYEAVKQVAQKHHLLILEDGAQGFGSSIKGKKCCGFGDISTTSFFPAKPLGCYGDGGAIFTDNDEWVTLIRSLQVHGKGADKYDNVRIGINSRLDTVQAAVLLVKLDALEKSELDMVNKVAQAYTKELGEIVACPVVPEGYESSWAQYTIKLENMSERDGLQKHLKEHGIPSMIYYPKSMHQQIAYADLGYKTGDFPVSEQLCQRVLALPIHPYISSSDVKFVSKIVREYVKK